MRSTQLLLALFLSLFALITAADIPDPSPSQPSPGNNYYNVFPRDGTDNTETVAFIRTVVDQDDLMDWTTVHDELVSWTVEASDEEISKIKEFSSISRVSKLEIPAAKKHVERASLEETASGKAHYNVFPKQNADIASTAEFIRSVVHQDDLQDWTTVHDELVSWTVEATEEEISQVKKHQSIDRVTTLEIPAAVKHVERDSSDNSATEKQSYKVFPKENTDISATAKFIQSIVEDEDLYEWRPLDGGVVSWLVEATPQEVAKLQGHEGIQQVVQFGIPETVEHVTRGENTKPKEWDGYTVFPKDGKNEAQCADIEKSFKDLEVELDPPLKLDDEIMMWSAANMTDDQLAKAKKFTGIEAIEPNFVMQRERFLPQSASPTPVSNLEEGLEKRDVKYATQKDAVTELIALSQPSTIPNIKDLHNYIYEDHMGKGTFVYHIEEGVQVDKHKEEFPNLDAEHVQTWKAKKENLLATVDGTDDSHSTCTASKIASQTYGSSKKTTLVIVRMAKPSVNELAFALKAVLDDVSYKDKKDRLKKSVTTMALSANWMLPNQEELYRRILVKLFEKDVPMVVPSGNHAKQEGHVEEVDTYPAVMEGPDLPLIVVGATDANGKLWEHSQRGTHVSIHAVGTDVRCFHKDKDEAQVEHGTSVAAPLVAGEIANLLAYDQVPFNTDDKSLVKNVKEYLKTDKASWEREQGIRVIWNGVTEKDNPKAGGGGEGGSGEAKVSCYGLKDNKYIENNVVRDIVEKEFCPEVSGQKSLCADSEKFEKQYHQGTPAEVSISIECKKGGGKPDTNTCVTNLLKALDQCDQKGNDNPENYKGGGQVTVGDTRFNINPKSNRQPASNGKKGGCESSYRALYNEYWVWGHGFASTSDEELKKQVGDCARFEWSFEYGLGDDGREWTAKFRTGVFQKKCVTSAIKEAGGPDDMGCSGNGS